MTMDRESELNIARDAPVAAEFLAGRGGCLHESLQSDPDAWWAQMHPAAEPAETFFARISWSEYPGAPPSVKFATTLRGTLSDPTAWPVVTGYRPTQLDICMPFTAEGFALHPDWASTNQAWTGHGNPFLAVVRELQRSLNSLSYEGRYRP
jgi:hypothetical protein